MSLHDHGRILRARTGGRAKLRGRNGVCAAGAGTKSSATFEQVGEWMYICQVHSFWDEGNQEWAGTMFGFAQVAPAAGEARGST